MEIREQLTGESSVPEWLSTHPSHKNRFTQLDSLLPQVHCVCVCVSFMMSSAYLGFLKLVDDVARSLCVAPPPQALALRDSCSCPALPATDPRAVFSKSVRVLLETAKHREGGGPEGSREPPPPSRPPPTTLGVKSGQ